MTKGAPSLAHDPTLRVAIRVPDVAQTCHLLNTLNINELSRDLAKWSLLNRDEGFVGLQKSEGASQILKTKKNLSAWPGLRVKTLARRFDG